MPVTIDQRDREGDLAQVLCTLWQIAGAPLRQALEAAIRDYAGRHAGFSTKLCHATDRSALPPAVQASDTERAAVLHAAWRLGDAPLREAIQQIIRDEVRQRPESLISFRAVIALHETHQRIQQHNNDTSSTDNF